MMTQPWPQIVARYEDYTGAVRSIRALGRLARQISESPLANGLFGWTSMFDLCIVQTPVSYPYDGPWLRISPVKCLSLATTLILVTASAGSDAGIWARSGIPIEGTCDGSMPASSPPVISPDKTAEVALRRKTSDRDDAEIALTVRHGGRAWEIALPMTVQDRWRPQDLLWSRDGQQFIVNGSENAYAGDAFVVIDLRDPNPTAKQITESAQLDLVKRFPPCKAANREKDLCRRMERDPHFNMSAITWTRDSHSVVVMAEVPSNSAYGGIMGQVEGYEIDSASGRILKRLSATELKARWQSEMAFRMKICEPATYGP